jgi:hypothetical protein
MFPRLVLLLFLSGASDCSSRMKLHRCSYRNVSLAFCAQCTQIARVMFLKMAVVEKSSVGVHITENRK